MKKLSTEEMIALVERSYFYNVDNKQLEATVSCFTEDAELIVQTAGVSHNGQGEIRRMLSCLLYTSPSPRDRSLSRMPSSA